MVKRLHSTLARAVDHIHQLSLYSQLQVKTSTLIKAGLISSNSSQSKVYHLYFFIIPLL